MAVYKVSGMTCGGCVRSLTNAFEAKAFKADVSLEEGHVNVEASVDEAKEIIENAGFDFEGQA